MTEKLFDIVFWTYPRADVMTAVCGIDSKEVDRLYHLWMDRDFKNDCMFGLCEDHILEDTDKRGFTVTLMTPEEFVSNYHIA